MDLYILYVYKRVLSLNYLPITSIIATYTADYTFCLQSVDMLLNSTGGNTNGFRKNFSRDLRILFYESKNFSNSRIYICLTTRLTTCLTTIISNAFCVGKSNQRIIISDTPHEFTANTVGKCTYTFTPTLWFLHLQSLLLIVFCCFAYQLAYIKLFHALIIYVD